MKQHRVSQRRRAPRTDAARRAQLLTAFDRSGLSAADFARQQGVHYTTFCGWRQRRDRGQSSPGFAQVEIPESTPPVDLSAEASAKVELVIEWGGTARLRLTSEAQIPLAAHLLQACNVARPC
jgi:hypothetical protein